MIQIFNSCALLVIGSVYRWNRVITGCRSPVLSSCEPISDRSNSLFFCPFLFSFNVTPQLKDRRLSEPVSPLPSELPSAIPAILSKAKGLLKKKLKSPVDDQLPTLFPSSSPTPPPLEENLPDSAKENTSRPLEVEELIQCSAKTRYLVLSYRLV